MLDNELLQSIKLSHPSAINFLIKNIRGISLIDLYFRSPSIWGWTLKSKESTYSEPLGKNAERNLRFIPNSNYW